MEAVKGLRLPSCYVEVTDSEMEYLNGEGFWKIFSGVVGAIVGGITGAIAGAAAGAAAGTITLPVIGTIGLTGIGAVAGGILGAMTGYAAGVAFHDAIAY